MAEAAILWPLDKGAGGLLVPKVNTTAAAEAVVRHANFYPNGVRGIDVHARSARYGHIPKDEYLAETNERLIIAGQIEGLEGLNNLDRDLGIQFITISVDVAIYSKDCTEVLNGLRE